MKHVGDIVASMRGFMQAMRGQQPDGQPLDDDDLEARALASGIPVVACFHWILQMQRHVVFGDPGKALACARKAAPILWSAQCHVQSAHYCLFESLGLARESAHAGPDERRQMRATLAANLATMARWAESCPSSFSHRYALIAAEVARLDGRDLDAQRLYEQAIELAANNGFTQDRALACEFAAAFSLSLGLHRAAHAHLCEARESYLRWGARAKVARLDEEFPGLERPQLPVLTSTIETSLERVDLAAIVKISQTLSGEIVHTRLIEKLMTVALEHAAAERGLLILRCNEELLLEALAVSRGGGVSVERLGRPLAPTDMPDAILRQVLRTGRSVIVDDAQQAGEFSVDDYVRQRAPRSILCLPLVKQGELTGLLYLENNLVSHVFTPARSAVLKLLSSQAAISLQNADLYARLERENAERRQSEAALRLSEERYALAIEAAADGHGNWIADEDVFYSSPRLLQQWGLPAELAIAKRRQMLDLFPFHPDDRARVMALLDGSQAGGSKRLEFDTRVICRGEVRWMHVTILYVRDESGKPLRTATATTDITDRKREQEELQRLENRLRHAERFEAMGTLAGGIAHDFNNILGAILGFGERALREVEAGSRLQRDLSKMIVAGERGRELVDRILSFSRGSAGERVPVHMEKVVREALALLEAKLPSRIRLRSQLGSGRAAVLGDATQIHQLLMNLGTNAVHAMAGEGTLAVALDVADLVEIRQATVGSVAPGSWVILRVSDEGSGIPPQIVDRIFDPFFTTKQVGVGSGLGLSLVLRIVTQAGGAIDVQSRLNAGTVFTVFLPRSGDAPEESADAVPLAPAGRGQRILVVDDEEFLLDLTTDALSNLGYDAVGFGSAQAALAAFRADPDAFDAMVTDQRMPDMSGEMLIREIRQLRPLVPVILVSGYTGDSAVGPATGGWADEVLTKPLRIEALATSLARVLDLTG